MLTQDHHSGLFPTLFPVSRWPLDLNSSLKNPLLALEDATRQNWAYSAWNMLLRSRELACWLSSDSNLNLQSLIRGWFHQHCIAEDIICYSIIDAPNSSYNSIMKFTSSFCTSFCRLSSNVSGSHSQFVLDFCLQILALYYSRHIIVLFQVAVMSVEGGRRCTILVLNCFFLVPETHQGASKAAVCAQGMSLNGNFLNRDGKTQHLNSWLSPGTASSSPLWS